MVTVTRHSHSILEPSLLEPIHSVRDKLGVLLQSFEMGVEDRPLGLAVKHEFLMPTRCPLGNTELHLYLYLVAHHGKVNKKTYKSENKGNCGEGNRVELLAELDAKSFRVRKVGNRDGMADCRVLVRIVPSLRILSGRTVSMT